MDFPVKQGHKYYESWTPVENGSQAPSEYQQDVMDIVQAALDAGLSYTTDVREYVKQHNDFIPAEAWDLQYEKSHEVEGGLMGMELYCARKALTNKQERAENEAAAKIYVPGVVVGTVAWNGKRYTNMIVTEQKDGLVHMQGKAGSYIVTLKAPPRSIQTVIERAQMRGWRK